MRHCEQAQQLRLLLKKRKKKTKKKENSAAIIRLWALAHITSGSGKCGPRRPIKARWKIQSATGGVPATRGSLFDMQLTCNNPITVPIQLQVRTCGAQPGRAVSSFLISVLVNQANGVSRPEQRGIMGDNWGPSLDGAPRRRRTAWGALEFSLFQKDVEVFSLFRRSAKPWRSRCSQSAAAGKFPVGRCVSASCPLALKQEPDGLENSGLVRI